MYRFQVNFVSYKKTLNFVVIALKTLSTICRFFSLFCQRVARTGSELLLR